MEKIEQKIETRLAILSKTLGYMEKKSMANVVELGRREIITLRTQVNELVEALEAVNKIEFAGSCCGCSTDKGFDEIQKIVTAALAKQKGG